MNEFPENREGEENSDNPDFGTIFSAPPEHNDKTLKSPKRRKIITVISAVLAVCLLVFGTLAVIKYIPEMQDENGETDSKSITVIDFDKDKFDSVTVENKNGTFVFFPEGEEKTWYVKELANDKISTSKTADIVSSASKIEALMEITKKTYEECGFENAVAKIKVASKELGDYEIILGGVSPDNSGIYIYSSLDQKIYLASIDLADSFMFEALDLANTDSVPAISISTSNDKYTNEDQMLIAFDRLEISGGNFKDTVVLVPVEDEGDISSLLSYKVISPVKRYANVENVTSAFGAFTSGITVSGVYSFDTDAVAQKAFGLDSPDMVLKLTVADETFTYKFKLNEDGNYAFFGDGMNTIKKISPSAIAFINFSETDFYNKSVYLRSIFDIKNMEFLYNGNSYGFKIANIGDDSDRELSVHYGEKEITTEYFQNFYQQFVSLSISDFSADTVNGEAELTVKIEDNNSKTDTLQFFKTSATEYTCSLDGVTLGKITANSYSKLINSLKKVSENKDVIG